MKVSITCSTCGATHSAGAIEGPATISCSCGASLIDIPRGVVLFGDFAWCEIVKGGEIKIRACTIELADKEKS